MQLHADGERDYGEGFEARLSAAYGVELEMEQPVRSAEDFDGCWSVCHQVQTQLVACKPLYSLCCYGTE